MRKTLSIILFAIMFFLLLVSCADQELFKNSNITTTETFVIEISSKVVLSEKVTEDFQPSTSSSLSSIETRDTAPTDAGSDTSSATIWTNAKVHYIDVGQGNSILLESDGHYALIDAGEADQAKKIISYLQDKGVKTLDYVVGTHPHSDHIGGLSEIIKTFGVNNILMPKVSHNTKTFEDLLLTIQEKGLSIKAPDSGDKFALGSAQIQITSSSKDHGDNLNNWSINLLFTYGSNRFYLGGDSEKEAESSVIASGLSLKADVLLINHHGSDTSSSAAFLTAVTPTYAVISVGKNNQYGHPSAKVLERLGNSNIIVYRTDTDGTIVATTNGQTISFNKEPSSLLPNKDPNPTPAPTPVSQNNQTKNTVNETVPETIKTTEALQTEVKQTDAPPTEKPATTKAPENIGTGVYITDTGEKYHSGGCSYLKKSKIEISLDEAKSRGYTPCSRCHPPQ